MIFKMIFAAPVGILNEVKVSKIQESLRSKFPNGISTPDQLVLGGVNEQIVITANSIQYVSGNLDINNVKSNLEALMNLLMLEPNINNIVIEITNIKDYGRNSMDETIKLFGKVIDDAIGVGVRNFFVFRENICEFKVEPYLGDNNKLFIQGQYNVINVNLNSIEEVIKCIINDYNNKETNLKVD